MASEAPWIPLNVNRPLRYPGLIEIHIVKPGKYFFERDYVQRASYMDSKGNRHKPQGGMMFGMFCGNVEVDFRGHTLGADAKMGGIHLNPSRNLRRGKRNPENFASLDNRNVVLRNGIIDLASGDDTGSGIIFANVWHGNNRRTSGRPDDGGGRPLTVVYEKNYYRLESMKVLSNKVAITMEGSYTVIRDCIIESADLAAVFLAGHHVLVDNCEIRLRSPADFSTYPRAAIVLRDGSSSIIRNNRIRVDYGSGSAENTYCILVKDGATDVVIENNTFINIKGEPVMLTEGATAVIRNNKSEHSWF